MKVIAYVTCVLLVIGLVAAGCGKKEETKKSPAAAVQAMVEQQTCPVMGGAVDKQYYADYNGRRIYFCCPMCKGEFEKDPAKYVAKVDEELKKLKGTP